MKRLFFLIGFAFASVANHLNGRSLATNVAMVPTEASRGTQTMHGTAAIATKNYVVVRGADDRYFKLGTLATDVPLGILENDELALDEVDVIPKSISLFGLNSNSLPAVAAAAIPVDAELVIDLATPGRVKALPVASGTYLVFGRSRFAVAAAGDPVSIVHCVPRTVVVA